VGYDDGGHRDPLVVAVALGARHSAVWTLPVSVTASAESSAYSQRMVMFVSACACVVSAGVIDARISGLAARYPLCPAAARVLLAARGWDYGITSGIMCWLLLGGRT
jgi:hypothetical protein